MRIEPLAFKSELKEIERLIHLDGDAANTAIHLAYDRWGMQPDLIRAETLNGFMNER